MSNKTALQTVLDDIKLFEEHYERSNKDAEYYENIIDVLTDEKHKIEQDILKESEELINATKYIEIIISDEEALRLVVSISSRRHIGDGSQLVKLFERDHSIYVRYQNGDEVDLSDSKNW